MTDPRYTKLAKLLVNYSTELKKGDRILCSKYGGTEIKIDGKEYKILSSDDILAVLE